MLSFNKTRIVVTASLFAGCVLSAGIASAQVSGSLWEGDGSGNADNVPSGSPSVTFTTTGINFHSGGAYTIGEFLGAGSTVLTGGGEVGNTLDNTHIQLTGSIFLNAGANNFSIEHDDGLRIQISGLGTPLDDPGPTSPVLTPFTINNTGSAGIFTYTLDYNECCGAPAALEWVYPTGLPVGSGSVPEAANTFGLLMGSIALLGLVSFKMRKLA